MNAQKPRSAAGRLSRRPLRFQPCLFLSVCARQTRHRLDSRLAWALLTAVAAAASALSPGVTAAEQPKGAAVDHLTAAELTRIQDEILTPLGAAFIAGEAEAVARLFAPIRQDEDSGRIDEILEALRREFRNERYTEFAVLERIESDGRLAGTQRYGVWVRLGFRLEQRGGGRRSAAGTGRREAAPLAGGGFVLRATEGLPSPEELRATRQVCHNELFVVERQPGGRWALVDAPLFDTLGHRQGLGLAANALLGAIGALAGLAFWVWMGCAAFLLRPRRPVWRAVVLCLPLLGALAYFGLVYIPGRRRVSAAGARD